MKWMKTALHGFGTVWLASSIEVHAAIGDSLDTQALAGKALDNKGSGEIRAGTRYTFQPHQHQQPNTEDQEK